MPTLYAKETIKAWKPFVEMLDSDDRFTRGSDLVLVGRMLQKLLEGKQSTSLSVDFVACLLHASKDTKITATKMLAHAWLGSA